MNQPRRLTLGALALVPMLFVAACDGGSTGPDPVIPRLPTAPESSILLFDDFDDENRGNGHLGRGGQNNYTTFTNWNVVAGCVDIHGNDFFDVQANNGLYVDLDGSCNQGGTIESKANFDLAAGSYVLEFFLAGNNRRETPDTVVVSLGTLHQEQIVKPKGQQFRLYMRNITVPAATTARIRFQNLGGDNEGALLDQVRLRRSQ